MFSWLAFVMWLKNTDSQWHAPPFRRVQPIFLKISFVFLRIMSLCFSTAWGLWSGKKIVCFFLKLGVY